MDWETRKHNISEEALNMPVNGAAAIAEAAEKAFHRYKIVTLKWDDNEYLAIQDTQASGLQPVVICTEPMEFVVYPECAYVEPQDEHGRTYLETICKALNNEH